MTLSVEHKPVQIESICRGEQQIQVLESLRHDKTLHLIQLLRGHLVHVLDRSKSGVDLAVLHHSTKDLLASLAVLFVACEAVKIEERLNRFWSQKGMSTLLRHLVEVEWLSRMHKGKFRSQARPCACPHLHAAFDDALCYSPPSVVAPLLQEVFLRQAVQAENNHGRRETTEVIHFPDRFATRCNLNKLELRRFGVRPLHARRSGTQESWDLIQSTQP
mmetsp:Transcript_59763/g.104516  ORF Transcript_59763/g.104516 Transcript_59763/m.104516 type:complete len:218 (+) Transcript_59763:99-752(+)